MFVAYINLHHHSGRPFAYFFAPRSSAMSNAQPCLVGLLKFSAASQMQSRHQQSLTTSAHLHHICDTNGILLENLEMHTLIGKCRRKMVIKLRKHRIRFS